MLLSDSLEVAIGMVFIFSMMSLVLTAINELIEGFTKTRSINLYNGIAELIAEPRPDAAAVPAAEGQAPVANGDDRRLAEEDRLSAVREIYRHPLIQGLFRGSITAQGATSRLPSYIPSRNFALALIDQTLAGKLQPAKTIASLPVNAPTMDRLALAAERIENPQLRNALKQAVAVSDGEMDRARAFVEQWYDSAMDRASGWYKRRTQYLLFWIGLVAAVVLNINALTLADGLSKNATLRRAAVAQAESYNRASPPEEASQALEQIKATGLPIGWNAAGWAELTRPVHDRPVLGAIQIAVGFLITALAMTLGAPFWFDILNRLMVIRATVKPAEKSRDEAPQDPQPRKPDREIIYLQQAAPNPPAPAADQAVDDDVFAVADPRLLMEGDDGDVVDLLVPAHEEVAA